MQEVETQLETLYAMTARLSRLSLADYLDDPCLRLAILSLILTVSAAQAAAVRIKDLVEFDGVRGNDLVGYGLVVGLNGTGDGLRNSPFTEEIMTNILERLGVNVQGEQFRPKNVAAVFVTATLPPFARAGSRIDVTVSAIGDASSLLGGTLVMTPLNAADGQIYAVAQGTVIAGGAVGQGRRGERGAGRADRRASIPRGDRSSARSSSTSPACRRSGWRCATPTSPPPSGSRPRSTRPTGAAWRRWSMLAPWCWTSAAPASARRRMPWARSRTCRSSPSARPASSSTSARAPS